MSELPKGAGKNSFSLVDAAVLFAELPLAAGGLFIDLACGPGSYSLEAARRFPRLRVRAFDLVPDLIAGLRRQALAEGLENLAAEVADIGRPLPLAAASVDACLMAMVVHDLVADRVEAAAFLEVKRVLKADGTLAVVEFRKFPPPPGPSLRVRLEPEELARVLERNGFRQVRTKALGDKAFLSIFRPAA